MKKKHDDYKFSQSGIIEEMAALGEDVTDGIRCKKNSMAFAVRFAWNNDFVHTYPLRFLPQP
jgi:hypothetical protein